MKTRFLLRRIANRLTTRAILLGAGLLLSPVGLFLGLDWCFPFPEQTLRRPPSTVIKDRYGEPLRMFISRDERWRIPVERKDVNPQLIRALLASEDRWFYHHPGVNPISIIRAAWTNLREGRIVSGASTIPMQIARMAEPKDRSFRSKIVEGFRALQLVHKYSRKQLLEVYLNITPYGGNIEGVGAASFFYFDKSPAQLSLGEVALLTVLPRSPTQYDPTRRPRQALEARNRILGQFQDRNVFDEQEIQNALRQAIPSGKRSVPFEAPHFSRLLADSFPGESMIVSTLDRRIQRIAEGQVKARIEALRGRGIENAAAIVIENQTRAVRALIGSAGFFESALQGQVNGAIAKRSPGSALKPFLFAVAFDRGQIVPDSFLLDIPTNFSGYIVENYDGNYRGRVRAEEALVHSLNASAVRLLSRVGLRDFHELLLEGGLTSLDRKSGQYGLPLILGAGEVRLLDLANLYASLAEGGLHRPISLIEGPGPLALPKRLFTRESAHWVSQALTKLRRPDLPEAWDLTWDVPAVAWKTGTSYGHRDAWALGFSEQLTIGVWVGNFDGRGQKGISGATDAAPLLFDLFRSIEKGRARIPTPPGLEIAVLSVCSLSHQIPGPFCPEREQISYLPAKSLLGQCSIHRRIFLDAERGTWLKGDCVTKRPHRVAIVEQYPAELVAWRKANGQITSPLPQLDNLCRQVLSESAPEIVSPDPATPYRIRRDAPLEYQKIPLQVRSRIAMEAVFWYQDGLLIASGDPNRQYFLSPTPGLHRLVVVDATGRSDEITYSVEGD